MWRNTFLCITIVITTGFIFPWSIHAQSTEDESLDIFALFEEERMVVAASKYFQKVKEAPSSVSIVTADEIAKYGYRTLADILEGIGGFYITYDRNYRYVGVRGFNRPGDYNGRILVLVDGHRINDNIYSQVNIGTGFVIDVDLIDRVEVIRSSPSGTTLIFFFWAKASHSNKA